MDLQNSALFTFANGAGSSKKYIVNVSLRDKTLCTQPNCIFPGHVSYLTIYASILFGTLKNT